MSRPRRCPVCQVIRLSGIPETWFFVGSSEACEYICSRECLVKYVNALPQKELPPLAKVNEGGCHVIHPHRRE